MPDSLIEELFCCNRESAVLKIRLQPGLLGQGLADARLFDAAIAADHFGKPGQAGEKRDPPGLSLHYCCFSIGGYEQGAARPSTASRSMRSISENDASPMSISVAKFIGSACPQITSAKCHSADPTVLSPAMIASLTG
jgi:hypothetical protein